MRFILAALLIMLPLPSAAAGFNCIAIVYHDPAKPAENDQDLVIKVVDWSDVANLRGELLETASVQIYYAQFGNQGGPTLFSGNNEYALTYIAAAGPNPERLIASIWDATPQRGSKFRFTAASDQLSDVTLDQTTVPQAVARSVLSGVDLGGLDADLDAGVISRADNRRSDIKAALIANAGCVFP